MISSFSFILTLTREVVRENSRHPFLAVRHPIRVHASTNMKRVQNLAEICRRSRNLSDGNLSRLSVSPVMSLVRHLSTGRVDVSGIYPPIATPFNKDESIAFDKLTENMQKWNKIPFGGYVVQGSNGEYVYQTAEERVKVVEHVAKTATSDKVIMAGSGCESTRDTIEMTNQMADVGAHAALVVTPSYYKNGMHNRALINHFTKVADASKIPILLYSVPGNTAIDLDPEVIIALSSHPNIIGLKDSGGDIAKLANLVYKTKGNDFQIMAGSAGFLLPSYLVGCVGGVCGVANMLGQELCDLEKLYKQGQMDGAVKLQQRIVAPNACVTKRFGVPGLKVAMEWFGYYGGPARSPLQPITSEQKEVMRTVFKSSGFLS